MLSDPFLQCKAAIRLQINAHLMRIRSDYTVRVARRDTRDHGATTQRPFRQDSVWFRLLDSRRFWRGLFGSRNQIGSASRHGVCGRLDAQRVTSFERRSTRVFFF